MKRSLMTRTSKSSGYEFKEVFNIDIGFEEFARSFDEEIVVVCVWWVYSGDSCNARPRDRWWRRGRRRGGYEEAVTDRPYPTLEVASEALAVLNRIFYKVLYIVYMRMYSGIDHKARLCIGLCETPRSQTVKTIDYFGPQSSRM